MVMENALEDSRLRTTVATTAQDTRDQKLHISVNSGTLTGQTQKLADQFCHFRRPKIAERFVRFTSSLNFVIVEDEIVLYSDSS